MGSSGNSFSLFGSFGSLGLTWLEGSGAGTVLLARLRGQLMALAADHRLNLAGQSGLGEDEFGARSAEH